MERQAATAKEYLRLREELKHYDVNLFLAETRAVQTVLKELSEKEAMVSADMEESRAKAGQMKEEYDRLSEEIQKLDQTIAEKQAAGNEAMMHAKNLEGRINVLNEQIRTEEMNAEHMKNRMAAIDREIAAKEEEKDKEQAEKDALLDQGREINQALEQAERNLSEAGNCVAALEQSMEAGKSALIEALNEKSSISVKKQRYDTLLEQVQVRRSEVAQKLLKVKTDEESWNIQIEEQEEILKALGQALEELLCEADSLEAGAKTADEEIRRLNRNLNNTQQEYHTAYTKLESLRNLAERYEGYGNSIRRVMECRDRIHGIHGVVADLIDVPKEYEIAIETALGGSIQNVVTDSEETAKALIEYLKKNKYGRATFLPLTGISGRGGLEETRALKEPGAIGVAADLVRAKKEYSGLLQYLLGRVLVADNIDHAIAIARKYRHSIRIVTLEGELLNPGGSLSGGAYKNSSNLLGRKREMEELEDVCQKALIRVDNIQKELVLREKELEEKTSALSGVKEKIQGKYLEENTAKLSLEQLQEKKEELFESSRDMTLENRQLEEQIQDIRENIATLTKDMEALEAANEERNQKLSSDGASLETAKERRDQASKALSDTQLLAAGLKQQMSFLDQNLSRLSEEMKKLFQEKETLGDGTGVSEHAVRERLSEIEALKEQIKNVQEEAGRKKEEVQRCQAEKEAKTDGQRGFFAKREEISERISALDKELFRLQNQKEKQEEKRDSFVEYMWNEYELTYTTAEALKDEALTSIPEMKKEISERKNAIRALGNVNVNAIEDYKEISGRYEFMKVQHDDLVTAQEALFKIIEELDTGMRKQFTEKFSQIRAEFDRVFKELFGGGHGTLELMEDEDILEAGIQIISQPPGKKLQNMMQMSGGEKALTAIALLFAIQNLKPSPFCLLDEIEAALDDSNVDRYAKYLHKLTKHTQFIVITHRKGTMVAADRLYGITMQEKGVSTLVSVNLIEDDLDK